MTTENAAIAPTWGNPEPGVIEMDGKKFMRDAREHLVPVDHVKPQHKLEDDTVRRIIGYADELSAQIARFRTHTFFDVNAFIETLEEQYGASRGGKKGNVTLCSYDGTLKVVVQVQDQITFGPELRVAKTLVDECITEWSEGARSEIRALVEHAFQVDKEGRINRSALFQLRRIEIEDAGWQRAMTALTDAMRVVGSKEYVRFYKRDTPRGKWQAVTIDLAAA